MGMIKHDIEDVKDRKASKMNTLLIDQKSPTLMLHLHASKNIKHQQTSSVSQYMYMLGRCEVTYT